MNWFFTFITSSIGKKLMMALTGLCFIGFLTVHLIGNLTLYGGKDMFNAYAEHLHSLGPIITVAETGLLLLAVFHVCTGVFLFYQNLKARPKRYHINRWAGGRSIGSATMPYTGFILLLFVIMHLFHFHFVDKSNTNIFQIVSTLFQSPGYVILYILAMGIVAIHISHGFWSLFQTIGANHPKYTPLIRGAGITFSLVFGIGFGFIPIYISLMA